MKLCKFQILGQFFFRTKIFQHDWILLESEQMKPVAHRYCKVCERWERNAAYGDERSPWVKY